MTHVWAARRQARRQLESGLRDRFVLRGAARADLAVPFAAAVIIASAVLDELHAATREGAVAAAEDIGLARRWRRSGGSGRGGRDLADDLAFDHRNILPLDDEAGEEAMKAGRAVDDAFRTRRAHADPRKRHPAASRLLGTGRGSAEDQQGAGRGTHRAKAESHQARAFTPARVA